MADHDPEADLAHRKRRWAKHPTGVCEVEGCTRPHARRGLCQMHNARLDRTGSVGPADPVYRGLDRQSQRQSPRLAEQLEEVRGAIGDAFLATGCGRGRVRLVAKAGATEAPRPRLDAWLRRGWLEYRGEPKEAADGRQYRKVVVTRDGVRYADRLRELKETQTTD